MTGKDQGESLLCGCGRWAAAWRRMARFCAADGA